MNIPTNQEIITNYLNYYESSIQSVRMREISLRSFFNTCNKHIFELKKRDLNDYFKYLKNQALALNTKKNKWNILISFLKKTMNDYDEEFNFSIVIPIIKSTDWGNYHSKPKNLIFATKEEIKQILDYFKNHNYKYYLMFRILAETGCRKGGLIYAKYTEIDIKKRIMETFEKTGYKAYYFSKNLAVHIEMYVNERKKLDTKITNLFVVKNKGIYKPYSPRALDLIIKNCLDKLNIKREITCHTFRRSINSFRFDMNCPDEDRKILLNHKTTSNVNLNSYVNLEYNKFIKMYDTWNPYQDLKL